MTSADVFSFGDDPDALSFEARAAETADMAEATGAASSGSNQPYSAAAGRSTSAGMTRLTPAVSTVLPTIGGTYGSHLIPWIGGAPLKNWNGTSASTFTTVFCLRPDDVSSILKGAARRTTGLETKFKRDDDSFTLEDFADRVREHMETHGMDSFWYLEGVDPNDPLSTGSNLFEDYSHYTVEDVQNHLDNLKTKGVIDQFGEEALKESKMWLLDSIDTALRYDLKTAIAKTKYGPVLWIEIVGEIRLQSFRIIQDTLTEFNGLSLAKFPGENVAAYCKKAEVLLNLLVKEGGYRLDMLTTIMDHVCVCTVEQFRVSWITKRIPVDKFVSRFAHMELRIAKRRPDYIKHGDLLQQVRQSAKDLAKFWPASGKGSQPVPGTAAFFSKQLNQVHSKLSQLDQKLSRNPGGGGTRREGELSCDWCKKPGFTKKTCPNPECKAKWAAKEQAKGDKNKAKTQKGTPSPPGQGKWSAPKDGEPTTKMIDGKSYRWNPAGRQGKGKWDRLNVDGGPATSGTSSDASAGAANVAATVDQDIWSVFRG